MTEKECCKEEDCECEDLSPEEISFQAHDKVDALIGLLIKKNLITEKELEEEYEALFEEEPAEDE